MEVWVASSDIIRHVPKDRKDTFLTQYNSNKLLFKVLMRSLEEKLNSSMERCERLSVHEYSNQAAFLADQHGYRRAIREIIELLPNE